MKILSFPFLACIVMASNSAFSAPTSQAAEIAYGTRFSCAPFPRIDVYQKSIQSWRSVVICRVAHDVPAANGGFAAIPVWAKLVGDARNGRIVWRYIVTPNGSSVLHLPRNALASKMGPTSRGDLLLVTAKSSVDFQPFKRLAAAHR